MFPPSSCRKTTKAFLLKRCKFGCLASPKKKKALWDVIKASRTQRAIFNRLEIIFISLLDSFAFVLYLVSLGASFASVGLVIRQYVDTVQ